MLMSQWILSPHHFTLSSLHTQRYRLIKLENDDAMTRYRWRDRTCVIAIVLSHRHRVIAKLPSHCRAIASSSSHHRHRTRAIIIAPSRPRSIAPNSMVWWFNSELRGPIRIPYSCELWKKKFTCVTRRWCRSENNIKYN